MTSMEIEKFTGDWLQKWKAKDMEITLDRLDTVLARIRTALTAIKSESDGLKNKEDNIQGCF